MIDINPHIYQDLHGRILGPLDQSFGDVAPIERRFVVLPADVDGPITYCFEFASEDESPYGFVQGFVGQFHGARPWKFAWEFNHKGACVGSFSSPRANAKEVNLFGTSAQRQRELLMSEVEEFCAALSQWIRDRSWARPPAPPNRDSLKLVDYDAPGIFSVVLAADPSTYGSMPTSSRDRRLHFGLTDREWEVLYFDVLHVSEAQDDQLGRSVFDQGNPQYPLLSRVNHKFKTFIFDATEIDDLESESRSVQKKTANTIGLNAIKKLLLICEWAKELHTGIVLLPD